MTQIISKYKESSIFQSKQVIWLVGFYFIIRVLSFSLFGDVWLQSLLSVVVFFIFTYFYFKNPRWCWFILLSEFLLAGSGLYLKFINIPIRAILFISFIFLIGLHQLGDKYLTSETKIKSKLKIIIIIILLLSLFYLILGVVNGYGNSAFFAFIPTTYLLIFFSAYHIFQTEKDIERLLRLIIVFILASSFFTFSTSLAFSFEFFQLQGDFFQWFTQVNKGNIVNNNGFFRVLAPFHDIIPPITLVISSLLMRDENHHHMWRVMLFSCLLIITVNFSLIYLFGLLVGYTVLLYQHKLTRWYKVTLASLLQLILIWVSISILSTGALSSPVNILLSQTQQFGQKVVNIFELINDNLELISFLGAGLGSINTQSGYLDLLVEFGISGFALLLCSFLSLIIFILSKIKKNSDYLDLHVGLLAGLISLLVINTTKPAFLNLYSILYIIFSLTIISKSQNKFKDIIRAIYRIFHAKVPL